MAVSCSIFNSRLGILGLSKGNLRACTNSGYQATLSWEGCGLGTRLPSMAVRGDVALCSSMQTSWNRSDDSEDATSQDSLDGYVFAPVSIKQ